MSVLCVCARVCVCMCSRVFVTDRSKVQSKKRVTSSSSSSSSGSSSSSSSSEATPERNQRINSPIRVSPERRDYKVQYIDVCMYILYVCI